MDIVTDAFIEGTLHFGGGFLTLLAERGWGRRVGMAIGIGISKIYVIVLGLDGV